MHSLPSTHMLLLSVSTDIIKGICSYMYLSQYRCSAVCAFMQILHFCHHQAVN